MAEFSLDILEVLRLSVGDDEGAFLSFEPGCEDGRTGEMVLEVAQDAGRGRPLRFVDGEDAFEHLAALFRGSSHDRALD